MSTLLEHFGSIGRAAIAEDGHLIVEVRESESPCRIVVERIDSNAELAARQQAAASVDELRQATEQLRAEASRLAAEKDDLKRQLAAAEARKRKLPAKKKRSTRRGKAVNARELRARLVVGSAVAFAVMAVV